MGDVLSEPGTVEVTLPKFEELTLWNNLDPLESGVGDLPPAIDDSDVENGCMRVVPRTHNIGLLPHGKSEKAGNLLGMNQAIDPSLFDVASAVDCVLKAGEASIHHGESVHGSNANTSNRRRCGMTVRFTVPSVKPIPGKFADKPILVRGEDRFGHLTYASIPAFVKSVN